VLEKLVDVGSSDDEDELSALLVGSIDDVLVSLIEMDSSLKEEEGSELVVDSNNSEEDEVDNSVELLVDGSVSEDTADEVVDSSASEEDVGDGLSEILLDDSPLEVLVTLNADVVELVSENDVEIPLSEGLSDEDVAGELLAILLESSVDEALVEPAVDSDVGLSDREDDNELAEELLLTRVEDGELEGGVGDVDATTLLLCSSSTMSTRRAEIAPREAVRLPEIELNSTQELLRDVKPSQPSLAWHTSRQISAGWAVVPCLLILGGGEMRIVPVYSMPQPTIQ